MRRATVLLVTLSLVLFVGAFAHAGPHDHHTASSCHPTPQQQREADRFADATIKATKKYADPQAALDDNFRPWVDTAYKTEHHYVNYAHYYDWRELDPKRPEALVYVHTVTGPKLIGVMYSMEDPGRKPPDFGGCITRWHTHPQCRTAFGYSHIWEEDWGDCPPGWTDDGKSEPMLHVWTVPMEGGAYAMHSDDKYDCWPRPAPC